MTPLGIELLTHDNHMLSHHVRVRREPCIEGTGLGTVLAWWEAALLSVIQILCA